MKTEENGGLWGREIRDLVARVLVSFQIRPIGLIVRGSGAFVMEMPRSMIPSSYLLISTESINTYAVYFAQKPFYPGYCPFVFPLLELVQSRWPGIFYIKKNTIPVQTDRPRSHFFSQGQLSSRKPARPGYFVRAHVLAGFGLRRFRQELTLREVSSGVPAEP